MKELKGTEKQVKYANDIKLNLIKNMENGIQQLEIFQARTFEIKGKRLKKRDRMINEMIEEINVINNIESAKEIIENYKDMFNISENIFLNYSISEIKNAGSSAYTL